MSDVHRDLVNLAKQTIVPETVRLVDERVAAATAPLLARIEKLERQVAELCGKRAANG